LVMDNVPRPYDLYKASDHFLRDKARFVQVAAADDSPRGVWSMVSRWLWPKFLGDGRHPWQLLMVKNSVDELVQIGQWVSEGKLKVSIDSVFEFEDAPKAFERLWTRMARGKVVVDVTERPYHEAMNQGDERGDT
jgi:NADPH:quinone reductase-like Zn-dependent oxidoreductase